MMIMTCVSFATRAPHSTHGVEPRGFQDGDLAVAFFWGAGIPTPSPLSVVDLDAIPGWWVGRTTSPSLARRSYRAGLLLTKFMSKNPAR